MSVFLQPSVQCFRAASLGSWAPCRQPTAPSSSVARVWLGSLLLLPSSCLWPVSIPGGLSDWGECGQEDARVLGGDRRWSDGKVLIGSREQGSWVLH
jgi:hypothetical protein